MAAGGPSAIWSRRGPRRPPPRPPPMHRCAGKAGARTSTKSASSDRLTGAVATGASFAAFFSPRRRPGRRRSPGGRSGWPRADPRRSGVGGGLDGPLRGLPQCIVAPAKPALERRPSRLPPTDSRALWPLEPRSPPSSVLGAAQVGVDHLGVVPDGLGRTLGDLESEGASTAPSEASPNASLRRQSRRSNVDQVGFLRQTHGLCGHWSLVRLLLQSSAPPR